MQKLLLSKKAPLLIYKNGGLFVNTLTANDKHYLLNRDNLTQPIQMILYQKQKTLSQFFFAFLKPILSFKHLPKKDDPTSWSIIRITGAEKHN